MSRLENRFRVECDKFPHFSTFVNLGRAVEYQRYTRGEITKALIQLVDKEDYVQADVEELIDHLLALSHRERPKFTALNIDQNLENNS